MLTTAPECRDWHEKQHAILETPVTASQPILAINVSHSYELKREEAERGGGKRAAHWELKARCHIIIVLWQVRASRR